MTEEILPNLFRIEIPLPDSPLKSMNSYVIKAADRNLIIDTGLNRKECFRAMKTGLQELDIDLRRTDFFITHLHADHFGLVPRLLTDTSKIYFNRPDAEIVKAWKGWESMTHYAGVNGFPANELEAALHSHPGFKYRPSGASTARLTIQKSDVQRISSSSSAGSPSASAPNSWISIFPV